MPPRLPVRAGLLVLSARSAMSAMPVTSVMLAVLLLSVNSTTATAQFNFPVPTPPTPAQLAGFDIRGLWLESRTVSRTANDTVALKRGRLVREYALYEIKNPNSDSTKQIAKTKATFCRDERFSDTTCLKMLDPVEVEAHVDATGKVSRDTSGTYLRLRWPFFHGRRMDVARYLRHSVGGDGLVFVPQFAANVSEKEAYVVTSVVRGLIGATLFSIDQASVVTRSSESDTTKRKAIEGEKANALRAINNGGTLVGRVSLPFWAHSGPTWSTAGGLSVAAGIMGPVASDTADARTGSVSGVLEMANSFPIRDLVGTSSVLADFIVSGRIGVTRSGRPLRATGGRHDVAFGQLLVGLRQNGALAVSALVTVAPGYNDLVPRLGVNFAATH